MKLEFHHTVESKFLYSVLALKEIITRRAKICQSQSENVQTLCNKEDLEVVRWRRQGLAKMVPIHER